MTFQSLASGTQSATVTTEHTLSTLTSSHKFQLVVDLTNMVNGDIVELRAKTKVLTGSTAAQEWLAAFSNVQDSKVVRSPEFTSIYSIAFTLKQAAGTSRNFDWNVLDTEAVDSAVDVLTANVTKWNGTTVATPATAGIPDVNAKNINNVAASSVTTINANIGTTQPVNFTGTGASALAKSDMVDVAGAAVSTSTAQLGVNAVQISGDGTAADNAESFFDGTGYAGTNNVIPTVTTLTNAPSDSSGVTTLLSRVGTPSNLGGGATIAANLSDIEAQTDDIGTAGAGLTAVPWNAAWDAEVQSEVDDALVAQNLDHLVKIAVDTDFATTVHLNSVVGHLADNGTSATFDRTTDSQEALRDRGDAAWTTATGFSTLDAAGVRTAVGLASANLDTQLTAIDDYIDTEVAAIKLKTDLIPAAPAAVGDIPTANQNADALLKRDWTAVTGESARSVLNSLRFLRNKWSISGTTLTVTKEDDTTSAWTGTVSTNASADPITGNDPS